MITVHTPSAEVRWVQNATESPPACSLLLPIPFLTPRMMERLLILVYQIPVLIDLRVSERR